MSNKKIASRFTASELKEIQERTLHRLRKGDRIVLAPPEVLFGFTVGGPIDLAGYAGYPHRDPSYYDVTMSKPCARVVDQIRRSGKVDPIRVSLETINGKDVVFVINGMTRAYAMALEIAENPELFSKVELHNAVKASPDEVRAEMIASNMEDRAQPWAPLELADGIKGLLDLGMSKSEVAKRLGKSEHWANKDLARIVGLLSAPKSIRNRIASKALSMTAALELHTLGDEEKEAVVAEVEASGKKATTKTVKKAVTKTRLRRRAETAEGSTDSSERRRKAKDAASKALASAKARKAGTEAGEDEAPRRRPAPRKSRLNPKNRIDSFSDWLCNEFELWLGEIDSDKAKKRLGDLRNAAVTALGELSAEADSVARG